MSQRDARIPRHGPAETPPLKPWPYYYAVGAYERIRVARRRRMPAPSQHGVRILGYHRVTRDRDPLAVSPDAFRRQMEAVRKLGARVIRLDAALEMLARPVRARCLCVTFDDGFLDTLDIAAPILREFEMPATVFLPTAVTDGAIPYGWYRRDPPPAMTWADVADLVKDGLIDVQSHTETHPNLPALADDRALHELTSSKVGIEGRIGTRVSSLCYPAGLYGPRDAKLALDVGYQGAVTCRPGLNQGGRECFELRRNLIAWNDDLASFAAKLSGRLDSPSHLTEIMQRRRAGTRAI